MIRVLLGAFALISLLQSGCTRAPTNASQSLVGSNQKWDRFVSKDANFSVSIPGTPSIRKSEIQTKKGVTRVTTFSVSPRKNTDSSSYVIVCGQFPSGHLQKFEPYDFLERTWKARFGDIMKDRIIYEKRIVYNGFPAIEFQYKSSSPQSYLTTARYCLSENRTYLVTIITSQSATNDNTLEYLDSFHILD